MDRYVQDGDVVDVQGLGLATVRNLTQLRNISDALAVLLDELAPIAYSGNAVGEDALYELVDSVGLSMQTVENGRCFVCNLIFDSGVIKQQQAEIMELKRKLALHNGQNAV